MWAYVKDGAIKQTNTVQTRLEINPGSYFPVKYANEWTKEQKEAYGVYEVVEDTTNWKDPDYYINATETITFSFCAVKLTSAKDFAVAVPQVSLTSPPENVIVEAVTAKSLNRDFIGCELNGDYAKLITKRLYG